MELGLNGKVVAITGGSQGIGKAAALEFAREGCRVCICARRQERLDAAKAEFERLGYELFAQRADVTQPDQLEGFVRAIVGRFGRLDVWINNAGVNRAKMLLDYDYDDLMRIIQTDLVAVITGSIFAAREMKKTGGGVILNAASWASITPTAGRAPYAACKGGLIQLTKAMAGEFAPYHIRVNAFIPGMIKTEISRSNIELLGDALVRDIAMRRIGEPEDLAKPIVFLASELAAGYIDGVALEVSGGKRCVQNPWYPYELEEAKDD